MNSFLLGPPAYAAGLGAIVLTSLILVRLLRIERTLSVLLALFVLVAAQVVLAVEALSLAHALSGRALLAIHVTLLLLLLAAGCRPPRLRLGDRARALRSSFGSWRPRVVQALALAMAGALLAQLFLVLTVPPNNYDSLQYHLPRALTYLQQGSLDAYSTPDLRETLFPANSEILILWQWALWPAEATAGLVQLLAWVASGLAVFGIAARLGHARPASAFAGLVFMSFPGVLLQASTTQNDLLTASFLLCACFFVAEAEAASPAGAHVILAALAAGLAVGTKTTALFALPGLALWALACLAGNRRDLARRLARMAAACAVAIGLLGAYFYVQNVRRYGHPGGPRPFRDLVALERHEPRVVWSNLMRLSFRLLDPTGVAPPGEVGLRLTGLHNDVSRRAFTVLGVQERIPDRDLHHPGSRWPASPTVRINEDTTVFGPVFGLLVLPAVVLACRRGARDRALVAAGLGYLLAVAALLRWQIWHGRILITAVALVAPLFAPLLLSRRRGAGIWSAAVALACASALFVCTAYNERKLLLGPYAFADGDRVRRLGIGIPNQESILRILEAIRPRVSHIAIGAKHPGEARYPLFGPRLDRHVRALRMDRDTLPPAAADGRTEAVLFWGESQYAYLDAEPQRSGDRWWTGIDLRPHLTTLRRPDSGWRPVVDADYGGHLFVRDTGAPVAVSPELPDHLPLNETWWSDRWVGPMMRVLVRFDPARPRLEIDGTLPDLGQAPVLEVSHPGGPALRRYELAPGRFRIRFPLGRLTRERPGAYLAVEIRCSVSLNHRQRGLSDDERDVSWLVERFEIVPGLGDR